jgi:hypothetical protein
MKTLEPKRSAPIGFTIVDQPRNLANSVNGRNAFLVANRRRRRL